MSGEPDRRERPIPEAAKRTAALPIGLGIMALSALINYTTTLYLLTGKIDFEVSAFGGTVGLVAAVILIHCSRRERRWGGCGARPAACPLCLGVCRVGNVEHESRVGKS